MQAIRVEGLTKKFKLSSKQKKISKSTDGIKVAVDDLSFEVNQGEVFGLLGPNGAGKTTTLRMLSTLIKPDSGDAKIFDASIVNESAVVRSKIGFLTGELKLEGCFSPNYLFNFFSNLYGIDESKRDERRKELFQLFGIDKYAESKIDDLSTGMKQKVSLVISMVHNPDVIIFDEPTNGLDIISAKVVTDFIAHMKNEGKTIILSTHIFSLVEKCCDRVGIMLDGKMITVETLKEIEEKMPLEEYFFKIYKERGLEE